MHKTNPLQGLLSATLKLVPALAIAGAAAILVVPENARARASMSRNSRAPPTHLVSTSTWLG